MTTQCPGSQAKISNQHKPSSVCCHGCHGRPTQGCTSCIIRKISAESARGHSSHCAHCVEEAMSKLETSSKGRRWRRLLLSASRSSATVIFSEARLASSVVVVQPHQVPVSKLALQQLRKRQLATLALGFQLSEVEFLQIGLANETDTWELRICSVLGRSLSGSCGSGSAS